MKTTAPTRTIKTTKPASKRFDFPGKGALLDILTAPRAHNSHGELTLGDTLRTRYDLGRFHSPSPEAQVLAYHTTIHHPDGSPPTTLFCAHLDTVDNTTPGQPDHVLVEDNATLYTDGNSILGADCGAGVWVLTQMIEARHPGTYLFTRGEERGGIGASGTALHHPDWLACFTSAVAFDRGGTSSVITHQSYGRCCSDAFALELAERLNDTLELDGYLLSPDNTGAYTDTAEWTHLIPECTNISIGYSRQHTSNESLDLRYLSMLPGAVMRVDWEALPTARDCDESDPGYVERYSFSGYTSDQYSHNLTINANEVLYDLRLMSRAEVVDFCYENPEEAAAALNELLGK
jgi:hypothetical protein